MAMVVAEATNAVATVTIVVIRQTLATSLRHHDPSALRVPNGTMSTPFAPIPLIGPLAKPKGR